MLGVQFLGGVNVLTGPSDEHWRAVRKGVSPAFSACRMRDACPVFQRCAARLADHLAASSAPVDMDCAILRSSMDIIGPPLVVHGPSCSVIRPSSSLPRPM